MRTPSIYLIRRPITLMQVSQSNGMIVPPRRNNAAA